MLDANDKVRVDGDFIYYNNKSSACHSIELFDTKLSDATGLIKAEFSILLIDIPATIQRVSVCLTIDDSQTSGYYFSQVSDVYMRILNRHNEEGLYRFELKTDDILGSEKTLILGEIYRYRDSWKFRALGEGFLKGLEDLCPHFGVEV
jgi:tellurium resistance protein TerD